MLNSYWDDLPSRSLLGWRLPLQRHGGFMNDDGFQNVRSHFDEAFRNSMSCWNNKEVDDLTSYRKLRDRQLSGMDRTSSMVEEGNNYKVVMDVHGFIDSDLKVTFLNEKELIVEGLIEKKSEGSVSKQSFKRRFCFPGNILVNSAFSTLSSDNILTITVPKQTPQIEEGEKSVLGQKTEQSIAGRSDEQKDKSLFSGIDSKWGSLMEFPITKRNNFFADSCFDNVRDSFKSRVSEIMNRRAMRDSFGDFSSFRSLKDKDEQNIAMTVTGDTKEHKIVLDVHGFNEGDLKVRAISDQELLVEGRVEKKSDNSYCNNSFKRSFCLPNSVNIQQASSNLSSDGVLTIVVPKKEEKPLPITYNTQDSMEKKIQQILEKTAGEKTIPVIIPLGYKEPNSEKLPASTNESIIPVQMDKRNEPNIPSSCHSHENIINIGSTIQNVKICQESDEKVPIVDKVSPKECTIPVQISRNSDTKENLAKECSKTSCQNVLMQEILKETDSKDDSESTCSLNILKQTPEKKTQTCTQSEHCFTPRVIPMNIRGEFQTDNAFDVARQQVESALKNAMNRSLSKECQVQSQNNKETVEVSSTSGTSTITDEIHSYKIVLDVFGFAEKDITVNSVSINELLVEGSMDEQKGNSITKHSFQRTFHLPDNIKIEESTSVLSSDGMLTINVPKKVPTDQEILTAESKMLTSESIEAKLSNLTKQMDDIRNIAGTTVSQPPLKEYVVPLNLCETSTKSQVATNISGMESKTKHDERSTKDTQIKSCYDLPIMKKGNFFQDSFFNDSRDTFESALRNTMGRFKSFSSFSDDLDFYKNLREEKFGSENMTAEISEDNQFKNVVVDVKGYPQDKIIVKVIEGNGILVEGKMDEKMDAGFSTKSFKRTFVLPSDYNLKEATSALSIDGILNIKIPKINTQGRILN